MLKINRWNYVGPMTRKCTYWIEEDEFVRSIGAEWKIERWYDDEFGWMQMHTADYIDEQGREVSTSLSLFPDDCSREEMLYWASVGEIDIPIERYDDITREEIIEIFERQVEAMSDLELLKEWVVCQFRHLEFVIRMRWYDFQNMIDRQLKTS